MVQPPFKAAPQSRDHRERSFWCVFPRLLFYSGQGITLTGLSGVTGASATGDLDSLLSGATFIDTSASFFIPLNDSGEGIDIANSQ
jgi:hypothetical protein